MFLIFVLLTLSVFFRFRFTADRMLSSVSATFRRQPRLVRQVIIAVLLTALCLLLAGNTDCNVGEMHLKGHTNLSAGKLLGLDGNGE